MSEERDGEVALDADPATMPGNDHVVFIGSLQTPWKTRAECPKNMMRAHEKDGGAILRLDQPWRAGLEGLEGCSHLVVLTWLHQSSRNLIVQKPRHAEKAKGVFALRSPVRPNPVGLHVVKITSLDVEEGVIGLDAIDVLDGTPVIDIKPYFSSVDSIADAVTGRAGS